MCVFALLIISPSLSLQDLHECMLTTFTKIRTRYLHYNFLKSTFLGHFSHYHNLKLSKTECQSSALYIATQINFPIHTKFYVTPVKLVSEKLTFPLPLVTSPMIYQPDYQHQICLQLKISYSFTVTFMCSFSHKITVILLIFVELPK